MPFRGVPSRRFLRRVALFIHDRPNISRKGERSELYFFIEIGQWIHPFERFVVSRNRSRIFLDGRKKEKKKKENEKLLKRAAKRSPTFIINSRPSPRWFLTPDGSQFSTRRPPLPVTMDGHEEFVTQPCHDATRDFAVSSCRLARARPLLLLHETTRW